MESLLMEALSWQKTLVLFVLQTLQHSACDAFMFNISCLKDEVLPNTMSAVPHRYIFSVTAPGMEQGKAVIGS